MVEANRRSAIDPLFASQQLQELLQSVDVIFVKGVAQFEVMQPLPQEAYFAFVVHSKDSQLCTGLRKGSGVFVRISQGKVAFKYDSTTLMDLYPHLG